MITSFLFAAAITSWFVFYESGITVPPRIPSRVPGGEGAVLQFGAVSDGVALVAVTAVAAAPAYLRGDAAYTHKHDMNYFMCFRI